jgi:hypothetical protein
MARILAGVVFVVFVVCVVMGGAAASAQEIPPAPRYADGHIRLGPEPGEAGLWLPIDARLSVADDGSGRGPRAGPNAPRYQNLLYSEVPFQPWARALLDYRLENPFEPHARCKPSGGTRQPLTPYGVEIFEIPESEAVYILDVGGPHSYRVIPTDGREHPEDLTPSYYGHSIGWWEDDTFVIDSVGYNERFWMDREGMPHTEALHLVERYTRMDHSLMLYTVTVDDPGAYTDTWTGGFYLEWSPGEEVFEYICQDNNFATDLMVGTEDDVDNMGRIVP